MKYKSIHKNEIRKRFTTFCCKGNRKVDVKMFLSETKLVTMKIEQKLSNSCYKVRRLLRSGF